MQAFDRIFGADAGPKAKRHHAGAAQLFEDIGRAGSGDRVSIGDMLDAMKGRAFGMAALAFALPVCFPMPPGVPTVAGAALSIVAAQMVMGSRRLWLPRWLRRKSVPRDKLQAAIEKMMPTLEKLERASKPRLLPLTSPLGQRFFGLIMLVLAIMLILPIPIFGNMPLGFAAAILAIGLIERDGYFVLAGLVATAIAILITGSFALLAVKAVTLWA